ncbi:3-methyl-2-oxobutanoate hydroxymethyltransferase [Frankia nepalensis]|uniref:3-methyl-2-oxobutanoate hydroxymethyltransferase n=1 Tax=Frankia nepalensis TaxID=1836974 RepID=A0A937UNX7_9ACTN|nr:3-methyl-2-oxobutanoate hydroxymethyltransferase [Frankia nepalensis]MBL7497872.1 3-methyl-2-oxobutanoate hydroxymethyltransferase [Frankia nepalensis]MBL7515182.1 3-methyl-2-oxobutanoate hydroxymethyltransferase [Frankia nepalensis]MBL7628472.1 3-methyl-2-oxobutanoate hydroxymethyltransferase [Frankia nepalensis]
MSNSATHCHPGSQAREATHPRATLARQGGQAAAIEEAVTLYGAPTSAAATTRLAPQPAEARPARPRRRTTVRDLAGWKDQHEKWAMLTAYDFTTAAIFDEAEVPVLLVGDSAANVVYGYDTTVPVSVDELLPLVRAVVRGAPHAMVVADLPFGSYQASPTQALETAARFLKEGGAQAVKLEGGARVAPQVELLVSAGVPVMGHLGLTPQSINTLGGYRVQGREDAGAALLADALAIEAAGAFAVVLEVVPSDVAARISKALTIPTVGIGAGSDCDAQVLVWQDMAGLTSGRAPRFVRRYADLRGALREAVVNYRDDVRDGRYPTVEYSYD